MGISTPTAAASGSVRLSYGCCVCVPCALSCMEAATWLQASVEGHLPGARPVHCNPGSQHQHVTRPHLYTRLHVTIPLQLRSRLPSAWCTPADQPVLLFSRQVSTQSAHNALYRSWSWQARRKMLADDTSLSTYISHGLNMMAIDEGEAIKVLFPSLSFFLSFCRSFVLPFFAFPLSHCCILSFPPICYHVLFWSCSACTAALALATRVVGTWLLLVWALGKSLLLRRTCTHFLGAD